MSVLGVCVFSKRVALSSVSQWVKMHETAACAPALPYLARLVSGFLERLQVELAVIVLAVELFAKGIGKEAENGGYLIMLDQALICDFWVNSFFVPGCIRLLHS